MASTGLGQHTHCRRCLALVVVNSHWVSSLLVATSLCDHPPITFDLYYFYMGHTL
eukprot:m.212625 g.212625  ORF g.212625 m.212625 type:complete len:55 (-) comp19048_c0_seq1:390-554(-)